MKSLRHFFPLFTMVQLLLITPGIVTLPWLLWLYGVSVPLTIISTLLCICVSFFLCLYVYNILNNRLNAFSNVIHAVSEGDYTLRVRYRNSDAFGGLAHSINDLANRLHQYKLTEQSTPLLLQKVVNNINVAIITADSQQRITLANPQAESLFAQPEGLVGVCTDQLGLNDLFKHSSSSPIDHKFPSQAGRWQLVQEQFYEQGKPHQLYFITDVNTLLREEELKAWKNLLRVVSHEINNSLTPIASISEFLQTEIDPQQNADLHEGLGLISQRAKSLGKFINSYRHIAQLPAPNKSEVQLDQLISDCIAFIADSRVQLIPSEPLTLLLDRVQIEQVIINLLKNALEAITEQQGVVTISWQQTKANIELQITDNGCGISNISNIFIPFYSTKKQGSGIGLLLCRQILEAHNASLKIQNNNDSTGVKARICFPYEIPNR